MDLFLRNTPHPQAKGDIVEYRQMGKERIALEYQTNIALIGGQARIILAIDEDLSGIRSNKARDAAQGRRLAAAAWAQQGYQFALFNVQAELL